MKRASLEITGMSCHGCEQRVENALRNVDGVVRVEAEHESDSLEVVIEDDVPDENLHEAIENAGYDVAA